MISTRILTLAAAVAVLGVAPGLAQAGARAARPAARPAPAAPAPVQETIEAPAPPPITAVLNAGAAGFTPITANASQDVVAELKAAGQYTTFLKAVETVNMTGFLTAAGRTWTVFAPTDAAFAALPAGTLDNLMKPDNAGQLQALVAYHLVGAKVAASQVKGAKGPVGTAIGKPVEIDGSTADHIKVGDAYVLQEEVAAANGVIYPVDKVLTPPA